jgi:hypothetical protein
MKETKNKKTFHCIVTFLLIFFVVYSRAEAERYVIEIKS